MAVYALLLGIEDYSGLSMPDLASASADLSLMRNALEKDLKIPGENILVPGEEEGCRVRTEDLALSMASFQKLMQREDLLIFYFSGHGNGKSLFFSDGKVDLQSVIDFIDGMDKKSALVILDCCRAGDFSVPDAHPLDLEEGLSSFAGRGTAVMASSAADQKSRLTKPGGESIFTRALTEAMGERRLVRRGRISLQDLFDETAFYVSLRNRRHPEKAQHPVFRSAMGGTLFFPVADPPEKKKAAVSFETPSCIVSSIKPMNASDARRLCAFVIPGRRGAGNPSGEEKGSAEGRGFVPETDRALAAMTREVVSCILRMPEERLYPGDRRLKGRETGAVWCYFAADDRDLAESLYFAVCIWAGNPEMRGRYYREDRYSHVTDGILVQRNISYSMLKKMQKREMTREACISEYGKLLAGIVSMAETFIRGLQEAENGLAALKDLKERFGPWAGKVRTMYIRLSDGGRPPLDLYEWTEGICDLAGWALDLSLYLERESFQEERDHWLIRNALRHYYESMDALAALEEQAGIRNTGEAQDGTGTGPSGRRRGKIEKGDQRAQGEGGGPDRGAG